MAIARSITVFLADDSAPIRARLVAMLGTPGTTIVGQAATPQGCIEGILATRPDVVVLDAHLEGGQGLDVLRAIRAAAPATAFIVFSNHADPAYRKRYLAAGALRFLDKSADFTELAQAVTSAHAPKGERNHP